MIISHEHRFIFVKPRKVAGTSVQINLARHCGPDDVVTHLPEFRPRIDDDEYRDPGRNSDNVYEHMLPSEIRGRWPREWEEYFKFSVVRNPWDFYVSWYWWLMVDTDPPRPFTRVMKKSNHNKELTQFQDFYFEDDKFVLDHCLRFERLDKDYEELCDRLGVPHEHLLKIKTKPRDRDGGSYQQHFDGTYRKMVVDRCGRVIERFGYTFD